MDYFNDILAKVGHTPLIKINKLNPSKALLLAKVEYFNPGGSIKDRIAENMISSAEKKGLLKKGGVIVENTGGGNTGIGIALVGCVKGYKVIITSPDKNSPEIINTIKAYGAKVILCPTNVSPDDPRSYYSVARKIVKDNPDSFYVNQYSNSDNPKTHILSTGEEIWKQTSGKVDIVVAGAGTGGTITGLSKYLRRKNPKIKIIGPDPSDSIYKNFKETGFQAINNNKPSLINGIGKDFLPDVADVSLVDEFIRVSDREVMRMTRLLAKNEGLFVGASSGAAMVAFCKFAKRKNLAKQTAVMIFPDSGNRYLSTVYSDIWLKKHKLL